MPKKLERCVKEVKRKIKIGKIPKTYKKNKKTVKTSAWAICKARIKKTNPKNKKVEFYVKKKGSKRRKKVSFMARR